jgi:hypothetical protein
MKNVNSKDVPAVSGGVKSNDTGDCLPDITAPGFPPFPTVPLDPEYVDHTTN